MPEPLLQQPVDDQPSLVRSADACGGGWRRWAQRWWYVVRYHRKSQLAMRLLNKGRCRLLAGAGEARYVRHWEASAEVRDNPGFHGVLQAKLAARRDSESGTRARRIAQGEFRFLNQERVLPDPIDWRLDCWPEVPHLWRFHLHYHEFLLDLAAEGSEGNGSSRIDRAWQIVGQWIDGNKLGERGVLIDAWHPYCISRRLPVWMALWSASAPTGELREAVCRSMVSQARFLERHMEWDLGGNHLLENAKALVLAGAFFRGPEAERRLQRGAGILRGQLDEQILPHGEHFELSPMYHALMLEALLDVREVTAEVLPELASCCGQAAERMAEFLEQIVHPDGEIPLLGDSCFGEAPSAGSLIARAAAASQTAPTPAARAEQAGQRPAAQMLGDYWIYRDGADYLIFDAGPVGPDHLPAHAHADLLGFEATIGGRRLFVDSGVFNYQAGAMRRACRSSRAHNVLLIDDRDQCDMWSRFRMGYRGRPCGRSSGEAHGFHWVRARHNAYRRIGVPAVGRWIACRPGGPWFCVDWTEGEGEHQLTIVLHLHPDARVEQEAPDRLRICRDEVGVVVRALKPGKVGLCEGWYCPQLGRRIAAPVVQWTATVGLPAVCGWVFQWPDTMGDVSLDGNIPAEAILSWFRPGESLQFRPAGGLPSSGGAARREAAD